MKKDIGSVSIKPSVIGHRQVTRLSFFYVLVSCLFASCFAFGQTVYDYSAVPPTSANASAPLVMIAMSRDNQLWHKAYNDYSDLDGDGQLDTTYNDNFEYYGYFRSGYCYRYASGLFSPASLVIANSHRCSGLWSGNFLNWLTSTRIDVVRKVLFGGYRSVDISTSTVLQRAFIPPDNHAFVKIVRDAEIEGAISDYTPITGESELSFCNVTNASGLAGSVDVTVNAPLLKVAVGVHPTWAGSETVQCLFQEEGGRSSFVPGLPDPLISGVPGSSRLIVRVETCVEGYDRDVEEFCREYRNESDGGLSYKPYGLLQTYGESGRFKFGLITGSYTNNIEGGVLRKNVVYMGGQSVEEGDLEVDLDTGVFIDKPSGEQGVISTLNRLRIQGWNYDTASYYDCNVPGISINDFKYSANSDWQCRDWGNPISEIYLEAIRYFAGAAPTPAFDADDSGLIGGLISENWVDPYTDETACSNCSIIVLSTGLNNFDGDQLDSASSLPELSGAESLQDRTDAIGIAEGLNSGRYIVGSTSGGGGTDGECDDKSLSSGLSNAHGVCPEAATLEGTFNIAGAAHYAHEEDLRRVFDGEQKVKTYTVSLAESLPSFEIRTQSGYSVNFVPTCRSRHSFAGGHHTDFNAAASGWNDSGSWLECSLVDLTVVEQTPTYGRLLISWEDSSWGNDYDMDAYSVIEYCTATGDARAVRSLCPDYTEEQSGNALVLPRHRQQDWGSAGHTEIQMRVSMVAASAGFAMKFGYVMNGSVVGDGPYGDEILRPGGYDGNSEILTGPGGTTYVLWSEQTRKFIASSTTPSTLQNPLWYAAKYGNFEDSDGNGLPNVVREWDRYTLDVDENGERIPGEDGVPDAYFPVSNPANLPSALATIFNDFSLRISSGSAAAVNSQTGRGEGAVYQALFSARKEGAENDEVTWVGDVSALFIDSRGNIREDASSGSGGNGQLGSEDAILAFEYDSLTNETRVQRYSLDSDGMRDSAIGSSFSLSDEEFSPLWSAQKTLSSITNYTDNRSYADSASSGRFIFTAFDRDGDGQVIDPQWSSANLGQSSSRDGVHAFEKNNFRMSGSTANDYRYLGLTNTASQTQVDNLVDFVRGVEGLAGMRSRTLGAQTYLLGDIVHSAPEGVGKPRDNYHIKYKDRTYRRFLDRYSSRRNMVYVGANDGMLHAFNAGVFDPITVSYDTSDVHPLGAEMWAYAPYNLLPHLRWLTSSDYPHVYYMDGPVRAYDVNIFADDTLHPGGWGTIIVAGMRFGGGDYSFDHDGNTDTPNITTRSAYVILDVTDPEQPPTLIAEISDEDLGFTTVVPTLVKNRRAGPGGDYARPAENDWFLVFGSGPAGNTDSERREAMLHAVSSKPARVYTFDLRSRTLTNRALSEPESFVGGIASGDWNSDFVDDAIYFGLVSGSPLSPGGKLMRGGIRGYSSTSFSATFTDLYSQSNLPFSAAPLTHLSLSNDFWVYAGTGRFFVADDNLSVQPQSYFGIKETGDGATVSDRNLVDVTRVIVFEDGRVKEEGHTQVSLSANGRRDNSINRFGDVRRFVRNYGDGWMFEFRRPYAPHGGIETYQRIRNFSKSALAGENLVLTAYEGSGEYCHSEGRGYLFSPHFEAGVPAPFAPLGFDEDYARLSEGVEGDIHNARRVLGGVDLVGVPSEPVITRPTSGGERNCDDYLVFVQSSTAELGQRRVGCREIPSGRKSWLEIPVSW